MGLCEPILLDPHRMNDDTRLASRAVRERWPVNQAKRRGLVERLYKIVEKRYVSVAGKAGEVSQVDGPADVNAIRAASVLVAMVGQNQSDSHLRIKEESKQPAVNLNIGLAGNSPVRVYLPHNFRDEIRQG